jgi:hypothetical protein
VCQEEGIAAYFPLDILMVPSSALVIATDGEQLSCDVFSLGKTISIGILEFFTDRFSGMSLSPMRGGSDATIRGRTRARATILFTGHDRGFHHGVPHNFGWRWKYRPPFSQEAWHKGLNHLHHDHIVARDHFDYSSHNDHSTMAGGTTA